MKHSTENIPENILRLRSKRGMSAADLARELEVSKVFVCKLENGDKTPSVARLLDIARVFGVTPNSLLKGL